jgi:hypothetical protein
MTTGLLDPAIVAFVFAPLVVGAALLWTMARRRAGRGRSTPQDAPASILEWIVETMPRFRAEWGMAMVAELSAVSGTLARWCFTLGCARAALFPPRTEAPLAASERSPILGLLAVSLPLLGLPFVYFAAAILDALGGSPYTSFQWAHPQLVMAVVKVLLATTVGCLVAGVPLGLAGRRRGERMPCLAKWGVATSVGMVGYFLLGMHWLAGGD